MIQASRCCRLCFAIMPNLGFNHTYSAWFELIIIFVIIWLIDEKDLQSLLHHSSARRRIKNRDNKEWVCIKQVLPNFCHTSFCYFLANKTFKTESKCDSHPDLHWFTEWNTSPKCILAILTFCQWKFHTFVINKILGCRDPRYKHENQMNSTWSLEGHEK